MKSKSTTGARKKGVSVHFLVKVHSNTFIFVEDLNTVPFELPEPWGCSCMLILGESF